MARNARKARNIKAALYSAELIPRENLMSRVHVRNVNWEKDFIDVDKDPLIVLNRRYLELVKSGRYDLVKLGECYHRALMRHIVDKTQNTVEIMLKCYGNSQ